MMRVVLDTNILVSALIWQGAPRQLLQRGVEAGVRFHTSPVLLKELRDTLHGTKLVQIQKKRMLDPAALYAAISSVLVCIDAPPLARPVCRDPDDDQVLACALAANADLIVSCDKDLLVLALHGNIPIMNVSQANAWLWTRTGDGMC